MQLRSDWSERVVVDSSTMDWVSSPSVGVQRKMLERDGDEVARATSIVRYAPGSRFPGHAHELGEELFVLEGEFCDESGRFGAGSYIRNPPGSAHAPWSEGGCVLFVKLRYFDPLDQTQVALDTQASPWLPGLVPGLSVMPLHEFRTQHTALVRWAPETYFNPHRHYGGEEILVVHGVFEDEHGRYPTGSWLRSPHLSQHQPFSREGCTILVKTGHLVDEAELGA
ncbi:cupin domain-containing protein [Rhodanobacter sp. AS-Z3]|uniref:cupin domain-containing protein n=1 Tax=Rhodanobacter sp. AS-Z3 TaxID=3031330 RepID=UPI002479D9E9|nr:cupin domain-containing protein [Rhodanobacter sp. AS-Z3]WEN14256.1 cupin domain-containing protein [Rhodanobacter sp. AS-Z3]